MRYFFIFLLVIIFYNSYSQSPVQKPAKSWAMPYMDSIYKGTMYVPFELTTLDGRKYTNESCMGKTVFFDFWFEGCHGCRDEFDKLNELYDSLKNDARYVFIAVTFDKGEELPEFIKKYNMHYPIASAPPMEEVQRLNYMLGFPSKVILDKEGRIVHIGMTKIDDKEDQMHMSLHHALSLMRSLQ